MRPIYKIQSNYKLHAEWISKEKEFGVVTKEFIPKNSIIEYSYCIPVNRDEFRFYRYGIDGVPNFIASGFGSLYNHSETPNIKWEHTSNIKIIMFKSLRDIEPNEELCHRYGDYWKSKNKK